MLTTCIYFTYLFSPSSSVGWEEKLWHVLWVVGSLGTRWWTNFGNWARVKSLRRMNSVWCRLCWLPDLHPRMNLCIRLSGSAGVAAEVRWVCFAAHLIPKKRRIADATFQSNQKFTLNWDKTFPKYKKACLHNIFSSGTCSDINSGFVNIT